MFVAQSEMTVAINALLDTFPDIRFDPDFETPRITGGAELRGVSHLNVRLR
jgi:cytochrome P450